IKEQSLVNQEVVRMSGETGIPLIATNDVHYVDKEDAAAQDILLCIQTGKNILEEDRLKFQGQEFYLKSSEEMYELFKYVPDALENTAKIAEMCSLEFNFGQVHLPAFDVPEGYTSDTYIRKLCYDGLAKRYAELTDELKERAEYELSVITSMGYSDYYLIVWDYVKFARDNGIMVGPGRGSGAGSLVAYCLGITNIDPIKYNLIFERFLNPERISMPDFDVDFCYERRQEVIDYVVSKYGKDRVAQIITFGTMAARAAIRDVGRALNIPYAQVDMIAKKIPFEIGMTIDKALESNPELKELYYGDETARQLIDMSKAVEGMPRHSSTHAAGVVISRKAVTEYVPLQMNEDVITTQFTMGTLEELGLLKMDFLGLRTLTVIRDTLELIKAKGIEAPDMDSIDYDDANVYKMISQGET
ncbi:MAG TPA: DNA polymerase III subunit alpha, partial [Bacillota bacterium]|nr:DNA polymerase III subunit alpha [Bacillota bacterium]